MTALLSIALALALIAPLIDRLASWLAREFPELDAAFLADRRSEWRK